MKYEELKDFILNKMRMAQGKNYQPVMIKTLNQNGGKLTKNELKLALQKSNPEYELSHFNDCPVFDVLTKSHPVARYDQQNETFFLLDYESYTDQEKAWITMYCDKKMGIQSKLEYFVLEDEQELKNAQKIFLENLKKHTTKQDKIIMGFPGPEENLDDDADFISNVDLWWHSQNLPDEKIPRFWNCFGIGEPIWGKSNDIVLEINPPMNKISRQAAGAFVKDSEGSIFICHSSRLGGNAPAGFDEAYPHDEKWIEADDGKNDLRWLILLSDITDQELPKNIADYVKIVRQFKSGNILSQIDESDPMVVAHKLFLIEMEQKKHKTPFTDFNHVDFIDQEIQPKLDALTNSSKILSIDKWEEWKSTPEKICSIVRDACASGPKGSQSLIWSPQFNDLENEYFDKLDDAAKKEFGENLYKFFKGTDTIEKRFNDFISFLPKIKRNPEIRLLAYLLFLLDSTKYFPIHPSNFRKLLEFYGFGKIKEDYWKQYSQYLDLATKLNSFLSKQFSNDGLTFLQIQSYMWVIAGAISKNYWLIRPDTDGVDWENQKNASVIGIHYYDLDLTQYANKNKKLLKRKVQEKFQEIRQTQGIPPDSQGGLDADFGQLEKIFSVRKKDKIVAISNNSTLLGIGNATDKYEFRTDISKNCHTVPVNWYDTESRQIPKQESRRSIKNLSIENYVNIMSSQTTVQTLEYQKFFNILNKKKQFFFYGPPGTGKTFTAKKIAKEFIKESETNLLSDEQYNEYVLSIINKISHENGFELEKQSDNNIIVKNSEKELRVYINYSKSGKNTPHDCYVGISKSVIDFLNQTDEENRFVLIINNDMKNFVILPHSFIINNVKLSGGENWDSNGVEDHSFHVHVYDDKSQFRANEEHSENYVDCSNFLSNIEILFNKNGKPCNKLEKVTFHQSFSYEEFIEGIRPHTDEKINQVTYPIEDGIFKRLCKCASLHDKENFVMIIDEINRGNISKIFGELITLLENDKRGDQVTLPYSKKLFSVPENLYVIGTMNTADRSLVHIDAALKRRFGQCELMPDHTQLDAKIERVHLGNLLVTLNQKIIKAKFRDNQIGHSYFMKDAKPITTVEELQFAFAVDIVPLLKDNFYDDDKILNSVLGDEFIDKDRNIISEWTEDESLFMKILEKAYPEAFD